MKNHKPGLVLTLIVSAIFSFPCWAKTATPSDGLKVVIIRHGEKPDSGDNLSCQGENRALQLPAVLYKKFNVPNYSYVPMLALGKSTSHARMFQTITPFAIQYNLTVNSKYGEKDTAKAAGDVMGKIGTVLMVWEHSEIQSLATNLGVKNAPAWNGDDFDSIWVITYQKGKATLTPDKEGISPSATCNF